MALWAFGRQALLIVLLFLCGILICLKSSTWAGTLPDMMSLYPRHAATVNRSPERSQVVCTQGERLARIDRMCERYSGAHATHDSTRDYVDDLSDIDVMVFANSFYVVPERATLGCLNWKAGSTTWRVILTKNSNAGANKKATYKTLHLTSFPVNEVRVMLKTYWKFMIVRHPLSRLISAFTDKLNSSNSYGKNLIPNVIKTVRHGPKPPQEQLKPGFELSFQEFIQYVSDGGQDVMGHDDGGHWHNLMSRCLPCVINYDHVVRAETFQEDAKYVIDHKLKGRGHQTSLNKQSKTILEKHAGEYSVVIDDYKHVSDELLGKVLSRYEQDMYVYGYNYSRMNDGRVVAECAAGYNNGLSCC